MSSGMIYIPCPKCGSSIGPAPPNAALHLTCQNGRCGHAFRYLPPAMAARSLKIAVAAAVFLPILIVVGALATAPPANGLQWFGSVMVVLLFGFFPEPAIYFTLKYKLHFPSPIALVVAFSGLIALAWFWVIRWLI